MSDTPPPAAPAGHGPDATANGRVFISYASQDGHAATRLCAALEAAGIGCWMAPRDVHPGESYAAAIVQAINACRALVLLVSQHSMGSPHVLREVERASSKRRSVISVRLDAAELTAELEYFISANQWVDTGGKPVDTVVPTLIETLRHPGDPHTSHASHASHAPHAAPARAPGALKKHAVAVTLGLVSLALVGLVVDRFVHKDRASPDAPAPPAAEVAAAAFQPPPHSVAVLPFENLSGDRQQDYFSDGLSEELLNSLSTIRDLQVAARTSSFSFKGTKAGTREIAQQLNVGALLEGSVRRDRGHVRVSAQLVNAVTGFQIWSSTYDRELKDFLALQTDIASAVTKALQATLLGDAAATIEVGGTQNPAAFDAYLRGKSIERANFTKENTLAQVKAYEEAVALDPSYARAYVALSSAQGVYSNNYATGAELVGWKARAEATAEKAVALAPTLGSAHAALASVWEREHLDFARARAEYDRAISLSPNDTDALLRSGWFLVCMGNATEGFAQIRKAISLDQLNPRGYARLAYALMTARRYREALESVDRYLQLKPGDTSSLDLRGNMLVLLGDTKAGLESCSSPDRSWLGKLCRSVALYRLHRPAEGDVEFAAMRAQLGESASFQYAEIETQRGDYAKALDWFETAYRVKDPGLVGARTSEYLDPIRKQPRYVAVIKLLNFPND
ncbi:MAG: hypothetical protein RL684_229 [Pseudomonadota bacterium]